MKKIKCPKCGSNQVKNLGRGAMVSNSDINKKGKHISPPTYLIHRCEKCKKEF